MTQLITVAEPATHRSSGFNLRWERGRGLAPSVGPRHGEHQDTSAAHDSEFLVSAQARLDNRYELCDSLDISPQVAREHTDGDLILAAYRKWGPACVDKLLGDFAFAVWDPTNQKIFCARDPLGVKPFCYFAGENFFACGADTDEVLANREVPRVIDRGRIADFLVSHLEGVDKTSTFYRDVHRLPAAHTLEISAEGTKKRRYWELVPKDKLILGSDTEYAAAFWAELSIAVERRWKSDRMTALMYSGGLDSSSILSAAQELTAEDRRAVPTLSIVSPDRDSCLESECIFAATSQDGISPRYFGVDQLDPYLGVISEWAKASSEPFDCWMNLPRSLYVVARANGLSKVLDGVAGDMVTSLEPGWIPSLLRRGQVLRAVEEAKGTSRFYYGQRSTLQILRSAASAAWFSKSGQRRRRSTEWLDSHLNGTIIHPDLAEEVDIRSRLETMASRSDSVPNDWRRQQVSMLNRPDAATVLERYHRTATAIGVEPLHPYMDRELIEFCLTLPADQRVQVGWTKYVVRQALQGKQPAEVVWRKGDRRRLGRSVTRRVIDHDHEYINGVLETELTGSLAGLVDADLIRSVWDRYKSEAMEADGEAIWQAVSLATWLERERAQ